MIRYNPVRQCRRRRRAETAMLLVGVFFLILLPFGCRTAPSPSPQGAAAPSPEAAPAEALAAQNRIEDDLGIEVIAIRTSAAGYMLDFRFKVLDREKAMPLFRKEIEPFLIDEASGKVLAVPVPAKGGPMRPTSRDPREGITYFMFFGNPGKFVKAGNQVTIVIDDHRLENLTVE